MSLPTGFLDELRTRVTLSSIVGRKVTWDMRKSNMAKGDFWAPCPFHQEKSASFHVDDRKGFYYCFGCHAKGDAVTFVKESENLGFMEAVEILAHEAGMQMPARDPKAAERADRRTLLHQVMDEAVKFYRLQLKTAAGAEARAYLTQKRRLTEEAWERWDIGWSPDNAQAVVEALAAKGISPDLMVASGVVARHDSGRHYDRFHGRIIFPIRDARGRIVSLGGRSLDPNARAKYLNGPETELFDKGRSLFNHGPAREAAGKGKTLIVAEGYMDVIALSEAGFTAAVAPLGTAVTEDQLRMIWRIADEPIMALDGDSAGLKAAQRVIDLALPLLEVGKALRIAILPGGMDPDDLIRTHGAPAMQAIIDNAKPMVQLLWQRETEGRVFDSPERRAALDKVLRGHLARITDPSIRSHYAEEMKRLRHELFGTNGGASRPFQPGPFRSRGRHAVPGGALATTRSSLLAQAQGPVDEILREAVILATLILHPALIHRFDSALQRMDLSDENHETLRRLILTHADSLDLAAKIRESAPGALDALFRRPHVAIAPPVRNAGDDELAALCLAEELAKLEARRGARREIEDAMEDFDGLPDEGLTWRLSKAAEARHRSEKGGATDSSDLGEDRAALSRHLQALIDSQIWVKKNR
ncbi:DNA primase [Tabrizicola caldifontis]|uniref:DNA primase n=1 Tax=Tabrizicola caldifontis TaxID=2528036 RepID=UPI00108052F4|nr:DNA primase [Rhodobacter sp. YIM 73028]